MRKQIRLSGSGGQGVITAAIIYAEAAVAEGKEAVQSQSYGPEARGGASKSEVIIDDGPIYHPHVKTPDVVLAMTQKAADKYYGDLHEDGILVLDQMPVAKAPMILVVNASDLDAEAAIEETVKKYTRFFTVKSRNMTADSLDLVVELRTEQGSALVREVMDLKGILSASLLAHDGEVTF